MSKFFLKLIFGFILVLIISFLYRINLDNCVLLVSCVDFLKTKFKISLSEFRVDYRFLLLDEYLSVSTHIFFCWAYGGFYHIFWPGWQLPLLAKVQWYHLQTLNSTFFWRGQHTKTTNRLFVSTFNHMSTNFYSFYQYQSGENKNSNGSFINQQSWEYTDCIPCRGVNPNL